MSKDFALASASGLAESLEGLHRIRILIHLLRGGPKTKTQLWTELGIGPKVLLGSALPPLLEAGLVAVKEEHRGIRKTETHVISLTVFGKKVAESLEQVDAWIRESQKHAKAIG